MSEKIKSEPFIGSQGTLCLTTHAGANFNDCALYAYNKLREDESLNEIRFVFNEIEIMMKKGKEWR